MEGNNRPCMMENGVLENHGVPTTGKKFYPVTGVSARRLPLGKIVALVAYPRFKCTIFWI